MNMLRKYFLILGLVAAVGVTGWEYLFPYRLPGPRDPAIRLAKALSAKAPPAAATEKVSYEKRCLHDIDGPIPDCELQRLYKTGSRFKSLPGQP